MEGKDQQQVSGVKQGGEGGQAGRYESPFMALDDLIYASLQPLAASNQRLHMHVLEQIQALSQVEQRETEPVARLKNLTVAYDKIRPDGEGAGQLESVELKLPLLSLVPLSQLAVEKANVEFHAEITTEMDREGKAHIQGRVAAPKQRKSGELSRISYQIELKSIPAAEGLMRLTDLLDLSPVARETDQTPVDASGQPCSEQERMLRGQVRQRRERIGKLQRLYEKIQELAREQERLCQICHESWDGPTYEKEAAFVQTAQREVIGQIVHEQQALLHLEVEQQLGEISQ